MIRLGNISKQHGHRILFIDARGQPIRLMRNNLSRNLPICGNVG